MDTLTIVEIIFAIAVALGLLIIYMSWITVKEGTYAVITAWGKYKRIIRPGFGFKNPISETVFKRISVQHKAIEIEFTAITQDQANVDFKALLLYAVIDNSIDNLKRVAFKFQEDSNFLQALIRSVEASIRAFVAQKKQSEILGLRNEIVITVKEHLDIQLADWGYHLIDLQINDILFDEAIMRSMAQVVSSENLKLAAYNEGEAKLIKLVKEAEAEKQSTILKGEGIAKMEEIVSEAIIHSANKMKSKNLDYSYMLFSHWVESMKHVASNGHGNVIFFDGSPSGMEKTFKQMEGLRIAETMKQNNS